MVYIMVQCSRIECCRSTAKKSDLTKNICLISGQNISYLTCSFGRFVLCILCFFLLPVEQVRYEIFWAELRQIFLVKSGFFAVFTARRCTWSSHALTFNPSHLSLTFHSVPALISAEEAQTQRKQRAQVQAKAARQQQHVLSELKGNENILLLNFVFQSSYGWKLKIGLKSA